MNVNFVVVDQSSLETTYVQRPGPAKHQLDFRDLSHSKNCDHEYALNNLSHLIHFVASRFSFHVAGGLIHIILVIAVIVV